MILLLFLLALTIFLIIKANAGAATVCGALLGVMLAWRLNSEYAEQRREKECRSLLVSFVHELEEDYHRCVLYHTQQQKKTVSFSAIFDFNDASTLSKLAGATDDPKIIDAIMFLKKQYFQVGRHVENASWLATEYDKQIMEFKLEHPQFDTKNDNLLSRDAPKIKKIKDDALRAQGVALAFFMGASHDNTTYPEIVDCTLMLIEELKKKWSSKVTEKLESRFKKNRETLRSMEDKKRQALAEDKEKESI